MKIKLTDPESPDVIAVAVDGKRVVWPIEFDVAEGWCIAIVPLVPDQVQEIVHPDPDQDNPELTGEAKLVQVKLTGKVEVIVRTRSKEEK